MEDEPVDGCPELAGYLVQGNAPGDVALAGLDPVSR
jgi:hypothetical protein